MAARSLLGLVFCYLATFDAVMACHETTFEFGKKKSGSYVYEKDGSFSSFQYNNYLNVDVPSGMRVSYVKVTVYAVAAPDVSFNEQTNVVTITYSWYQITISTYSLFALAVPDT